MRPPRFAYEDIAKDVLPGWEVSLAFVTPATAKRLNMQLRKKSYTPNVLSYKAGAKHGEIIICLEVAKKQAPDYGMPYPKFVLYLFIHGLLHLEGRRHGTTMEKREEVLLMQFSSARPNGTKNRNRNRHRNLPGQGGSRRRNSR